MRKIRGLISILVLFLVMSVSIIASAYNNVLVELTTNNTEIKKGDEIEVLFSFKTDDVSNKDITAFKATLDYDKNVIENIVQSNFEALNSWQELLYNPENNQFIAINKSGELKGKEVVKIKLKAKTDISSIKTSIKVKDVTISDGKKDIVLNSSEIQVEIIEEQGSDETVDSNTDGNTGSSTDGNTESGGTSSNNNNNNNGQQNTGSSNNSSNNQLGNNNSVSGESSNNHSSDNNSSNNLTSNSENNQLTDATNNEINKDEDANNQLTDTDSSNINSENSNIEESEENDKNLASNKKAYTKILFIILMIILIILILIAVKKKLEDKDGKLNKKNKIIFIIIAALLILIQIVTITKAITSKGELNGDGEINYKDVSILEQHLIDLKQLPEEKLDDADINLDGKVNLTDLTLLVKKIEKTLVYEVDITSNIENYYPNKNEEIEFKFSASVSYGAAIEEVTINDESYKVNKDPDTNDYFVKINVGDKSGIKEFNITKVKLDVGKEVNVKLVERLEVLKEEPTIENYRVSELTEEVKMQVAFELKDIDSSVQSSKIEVIEKDTENIFKQETVTVGQNKFTFDLEEGKEYILNIYVDYDLDTNELTDHEKDNSGSIIKSYDLQLNTDYKFQFNNLKTLNDKGEETSVFNKKEPIIINFNSENATVYSPSTIKVNDVDYQLSKNENTYKATLNGVETTGEYEIKVQEVVLENGKVISLNENNIVKVQINKEKPSVENVNIKELDDKFALDIAFEIKDNDNSITKKSLVIKNDKDEVVFEKEFEGLEFKEVCEVSNKLSANYKIEVKVDYDTTIDNSQPLKEQIIYTQTLEAKPRVNIIDSKLSSTVVEKNQEINITYTIETNSTSLIKQLVINNTTAIAEKKADNTYEVTLKAPDKAGTNELKLTRVIFEDGVELIADKVDSIEVLKDIPVVNNYNIEEDYDNEKIKFNFNIEDKDNAFVSGKVQLTNKDGSDVKEEAINKLGENSFELSVKELEEYTFKVILTYKRDELGNTLVEEKVFLEEPIQMIRDYNLQVSDIKTYNDKETKYFNKNQLIKITFTSTNSSKFVAEKAQINGTQYSLTQVEANKYEATIDGFSNAGVSDIKIEKIWLSNTKELTVDKNNTVQIEVLKDAPIVESFTYEEASEEKVKVSFKIKDDEAAFKKGKLIIKDANNEIFTTEALKVGENQFEFTTNLSEDYTAEILLDYDLDTNALEQGQNEYTSQKVAEKSITISKELVEVKDIESVKLYRKNGQGIEEVTKIDITNFNANEYVAEVSMKNIPTLYAEVKEGKVVGRDFKIVLNYDNSVQYDGDQKINEIEVKFGEVDSNVASNIGFNELISIIQKDPTATINLTADLDASTLNVSTATYLGDFKGTINGNGHTIKNLSKPLFNELQNAKIENLIIENSKVTGNNRGILADKAIGSTITNVHINNSRIEVWHSRGAGSFLGSAEDSTIIKECSANNVFIQSYKVVGGFVGYLMRESTIENSYIKGTVKAGYDAVGGMVGQTSGLATIQNSYADVTLDMTVDWAVGGLVGYSDRSNVTLKNNISLATGNKGKRVKGSGTGYNSQSNNNYEISESTLGSNVDGNKVKVISKNDINETFLKNELNWDTAVWNLVGATGDKMPALKNSDPSNLYEEAKPQNDTVYIPNFERISKLESYDSNKEIAYHNMHILMPFYDSKLYVDYGNKIAENDKLNTSKIKTIIAYDENSKMISGLNSNNYSFIKKIKVIFEDDIVKEYNLTFKKKLNDIASYKIEELDILYTYNKFILNTDISVIDEIVNKAAALDYTNDIASVTAEEESRLYVDYYNENVKNKIREVIIGILQNEDKYNLYLDNEILKEKIKNELFTDKQLEKLIYTYNYFEKWYKIDIGGIRVSDLIFFNGETIFNKEYDIKKLTEKTMSVKSTSRETKNTIEFYNNILKQPTNKTIKEFLEYYMAVEGITDANDWFTNSFKGIINEKPAIGKEDKIDYRAWTLLNKRNEHLLPILTAPQEDMYIISVPSQVIMGSLNRYSNHLNGNIEAMINSIEGYATKIQNFYSISASFIDNSENILNKRTHIQYDTRFNFPNSGDQDKGTTQDPVIKWVYEAVDRFALKDGSGAYANGTDVYWVAYNALGGDFSFKVFTHETAHNQDGYYFYEEKGRRKGTGAEDHADANIAQDLDDGSLVFNIRGDFNIEDDISNNITMDRINSKEKIHSYYKEMFETYYVLDYLTAQALLQLTPEQQAKLVTQANYIDDDNPDDGGQNTNYTALTAEQIRAMNLQTIEDLYDNRIVFRQAGEASGNMPGRYGGDNHYSIYWYQPHNDNGRPDSYSFKRLGFELLGVGGYTNGYVAYRSTMSANDLEALRTATGNESITWKQYKMDRFNNVKNNLNKIQYFNVNDAIELYKEALIKDSTAGNRNQTNNVRRVLYGIVKRATGDFTNSTVYEMKSCTEISSAQQLIDAIANNQMGNYKLVADIDFTNIDVSNKEAYILTTFLGTIDGNGYKIKGLSKPLFKRTTYANIKNIIIEAPAYVSDVKAALMVETKNSMIENLNIIDSNVKLPLVSKTEGSLQMSGTVENNIRSNKIETIDDLLKINENASGLERKMKFELAADIDASSLTSTEYIILGEFLGEINGNGHKIYNLKVPIFQNLKGKIYNLRIEDSVLGSSGKSNVGALAGTSTNAVIENVKLNNIEVTGRDNVSSLVGVSNSTTFSKISATNIKITGTHFYAGGLIGRSFDSKIYDVMIEGELNIKDTHNGGLIGALNRDVIERVYVDVDVTRTSIGDNRNKNAGLYGAIEKGAVSVKDVVVVGNMSETLYKITPATNDTEINEISKYLTNVYELKESTGLTNVSDKVTINSVDTNEIKDRDFYINKLNWSEEVWDFSNITSGQGPQIK